jgi:hypothetical protein
MTRNAAKPASTVLEHGSIFFFYRPKVQHTGSGHSKDVQRLYMVLSPDTNGHHRLIVITKKELPRAKGETQHWGFVDIIASKAEKIRKELNPVHYQTKTRGTRDLPGARPAGEGLYCIARHDNHTHFIFALEIPKQPGEVQKQFGIEQQGNYIITIKNPQRKPSRRIGLRQEEKATFPRDLEDRFQGKAFGIDDPPAYLDYEGTEFILIAVSKDVKEDLGITLRPKKEPAGHADIARNLGIDAKPLVEGKWQ